MSPKKDNPSIEPEVNGPYLVKKLTTFKNSKGETVQTKPVMKLCSCGGSGNKPYCDGTHLKNGFNTDKAEDRVPDRVDVYVGKEITIYDNEGFCARAGYCWENSPAVFDGERKPWIDPDADDAEKTARTIRMCPSGTLSYTKDGIPYKDQDRGPAIEISKNGPYKITGGIEFNHPKGSRPESKEHYTLCRCGASKNKPFCTGEHLDIKFEDEKN